MNLSKYITNLSHSSGNLPVNKVREFIKELKEKLKSQKLCCKTHDGLTLRIIDKLAGDKLINSPHSQTSGDGIPKGRLRAEGSNPSGDTLNQICKNCERLKEDHNKSKYCGLCEINKFEPQDELCKNCRRPFKEHGEWIDGIYYLYCPKKERKVFKLQDELCKNCGFEKRKHNKKGYCMSYDMSYGETIRHPSMWKFEPQDEDKCPCGYDEGCDFCASREKIPTIYGSGCPEYNKVEKEK